MALTVHAEYIKENQDHDQIRRMVRRLIYKEWSLDQGKENYTAIVATEAYDPIDEESDLVLAVVGHPATVRMESRVRHGMVRVFDKNINPIGGLSLPPWMSSFPVALVSMRGSVPHRSEALWILRSALQSLLDQLKVSDLDFCSSFAKRAIQEDRAQLKWFAKYLKVHHWDLDKPLLDVTDALTCCAIIYGTDTAAYIECQNTLKWASFIDVDDEVGQILKSVRTIGAVILIQIDEDVNNVVECYENLTTEWYNSKTADWEEELHLEDMYKKHGMIKTSFIVIIW